MSYSIINSGNELRKLRRSDHLFGSALLFKQCRSVNVSIIICAYQLCIYLCHFAYIKFCRTFSLICKILYISYCFKTTYFEKKLLQSCFSCLTFSDFPFHFLFQQNNFENRIKPLSIYGNFFWTFYWMGKVITSSAGSIGRKENSN